MLSLEWCWLLPVWKQITQSYSSGPENNRFLYLKFNMNQSIELAIIRIYNQSNNVIGTAFFVDDTRALTCAHVVQDALGISIEIEVSSQLTVKIDFPLLPQQKICFARVAFL